MLRSIQFAGTSDALLKGFNASAMYGDHPAGRQRQERHVGRYLEFLCAAPASLIEDENGVGAGCDPGDDLVEMKLHGLAIARPAARRRRRSSVQGRPRRTERSTAYAGAVWRGDVSPSAIGLEMQRPSQEPGLTYLKHIKTESGSFRGFFLRSSAFRDRSGNAEVLKLSA
jgi:hypothetical protein